MTKANALYGELRNSTGQGISFSAASRNKGISIVRYGVPGVHGMTSSVGYCIDIVVNKLRYETRCCNEILLHWTNTTWWRSGDLQGHYTWDTYDSKNGSQKQTSSIIPRNNVISIIQIKYIIPVENFGTWWRYPMETFSALLAFCVGNSLVTAEFPVQRPVTRSIDVFFEMRLHKWLSKQSRGWWFETQSRALWRHCNEHTLF